LLQIPAMMLQGITTTGLLNSLRNKNASFIYEIISSVSHNKRD